MVLPQGRSRGSGAALAYGSGARTAQERAGDHEMSIASTDRQEALKRMQRSVRARDTRETMNKLKQAKWIAFDTETGDLYIADVGQGEIEEVDFQPGSSSGGENYGWDCMEGNECSADSSGCNNSGCVCDAPGLTPPIHQYTHSDGEVITGGEIYRGCAVADLDSTYFFADFDSNRIWSFVYNGMLQNFVERTSELDPSGALSIASISSFGRDAFGEIYICDLLGGEVFKIIPDTAGPALDCNENSVEDACDIRGGTSVDSDQNGIPDECEVAVPATSPMGLLIAGLVILTASMLIGVRQWRTA